MRPHTQSRYRGVAAIQPTGLRSITLIALLLAGPFLALFMLG